MIATVRLNTPWSIPLHLFGAGHPMIIPFAVALGVDMFDSASYILYARDNRLMTETRTYRLEELEYMPCSTPICVKYSPKELLEMPKNERVRLLALHNLYVLAATIRQVRQAIREGRLWELIEEKSKAHPSLLRALKTITKYRDYIAQHSPRIKGGKAKGIFIYAPESAAHPRILQHVEMTIRRYKRPRLYETAILIPASNSYKPFTRAPLYRWVKRHREGHIVGYTLALGPIPEELAETYPLSQHESSCIAYTELVEETVNRLTNYIISQSYLRVEIYACKSLEWSVKVAQNLYRKLIEEHGMEASMETVDECDKA
jgi:7-cyano-7-deazaguanine tRNA-ribosyltransferase